MCNMLLEVMHELWVENIERVIFLSRIRNWSEKFFRTLHVQDSLIRIGSRKLSLTAYQ
jgi:hypothetical protein